MEKEFTIEDYKPYAPEVYDWLTGPLDVEEMTAIHFLFDRFHREPIKIIREKISRKRKLIIRN